MTDTIVRESGREPVQIVEIQQPLCANVFGSSPCTATGTADQKCYNTRSSCLDGDNFALGGPLSLYFTTGDVASRLDVEYLFTTGAEYIRTTSGEKIEISSRTTPAYLIPSLVSVSTSPTQINLAGANPDTQGLGLRALVNITFQDHPHNDRAVDPYRDGRSWNGEDRGSFWTKWLVRNKYRQDIVINVYDGYYGQSLSDMIKRTYFLQEASWPDASGRVKITAKDVLAKAEERKAQAPAASPGELYANITAGAATFEVSNAVVGDYSASGTVRIDDELITYSSVVTSSNGVTFTVSARGTDGTTADSHTAEAGVQECLRIENLSPEATVQLLLEDHAGIDTSYMDLTGWADEAGTYLAAYKCNDIITTPTAVSQLLSDLQIQCLFYLWWDERYALIKLKTIRGISEEPVIMTAESNILAGSFSIKEKPRERASQVWFYYGRKSYVESPTSPENYTNASVVADLESEGADKYGVPSIRKIYGRFIRAGALADNTAGKIVFRYVDNPRVAIFQMDVKDRQYWVGDTIQISHHGDLTDHGERKETRWTITSAEETKPGELARYTAEDTTLYGKIYFIMAGGAADYPGYDNAPFKNCYIGDASGLLSDGEPCGSIS